MSTDKKCPNPQIDDSHSILNKQQVRPVPASIYISAEGEQTMEPFEIVMGSENDAEVNELSSRSSSADDMTRFLKSLGPEQIAELAQDREELRALYNELRAI